VVVAWVVVVEMDVVVGVVTEGWVLVTPSVEPASVVVLAPTLACAWTMTD
jgi:hypothetical protein